MASLAARYATGEHEAVWRELDFDMLPIKEQFEIGYDNWVSPAEAEDVMRQTFERVARNVDRVVGRLRDLGYLFECEAGRYGAAYPPRSPGLDHALRARDATLERFDELDANGSGPFPLAFVYFAELVGSVDLRQRFPADKTPKPKAGLLGGIETLLQRNIEAQIDILRDVGDPPDQTAKNRENRLRVEAGDVPFDSDAEDKVLHRLGDWDPLEIDFEYLAYSVGEEEAEMLPLPDGGLALHAEFAASFEHKANISGAWNPTVYLPSYRADPMVYAEGIHLPFTTYLRRVFRRGGFFGTPRPFFRADEPAWYMPEAEWPPLNEVEPGIFLPKHPIFVDLAADLEPF